MRIKMFCLLSFTLVFFVSNGRPVKKAEVGCAEERAVCLVKHYWDKFDFTDTARFHLPEVMEQMVSDYIGKLECVPAEVASSSIKDMMNKASADSTVFAGFAALYEKLLYDPGSPMRDESLYIYVLEAVLESPVLDEVNKIRPAHLLELALKNRVGEPAADFAYTLADGTKGTLYHTEADYLLLFFYDPDCHACKEVTGRLVASPLVAKWIADNKLKILAVYPDGDPEVWEKHLPDMPAGWINSYDSTMSLKNDEVYDLKATPTLYLLDKDKKVILKDTTFDQVEMYLSR